MGNDGGTKALSRKYSRWSTKKEVAHVESEEAIQGKWSTCALSGEVLQEPICSDELGYLFNKDAVIQAIIDKSLPAEFSHIRKLRDVVDLKFAVNPDYSPKYEGNSKNYWQQDILGGKYICPITKETIGGKTRFCYIRSCGCVVAEKAIKEIPSSNCLVCGKPYEEDDIIVLNGTTEDRVALRERMEKRRLKEKKSKKRHEKPIEGTDKRPKT